MIEKDLKTVDTKKDEIRLRQVDVQTEGIHCVDKYMQIIK